jgi:hypothetical protein
MLASGPIEVLRVRITDAGRLALAGWACQLRRDAQHADF